MRIAGLPARAALAYLCSVVSLACGIGLLWPRAAAVAARALFVCLLLWLLLFKARFVFPAPTVEVSCQTCGETAVIVAGAWVLYAWFAPDRVFTLLVWGPILAAGQVSAQHWVEFVLSWTITVGGWVVADSYRALPWLAVNKR